MDIFQKHVYKGFRYNDDVVLLWTGTLEECHEFIGRLNGNMVRIFLTSNVSCSTADFLDLKITISKGRIETSLYKKKTATNNLLHFSSF